MTGRRWLRPTHVAGVAALVTALASGCAPGALPTPSAAGDGQQPTAAGVTPDPTGKAPAAGAGAVEGRDPGAGAVLSPDPAGWGETPVAGVVVPAGMDPLLDPHTVAGDARSVATQSWLVDVAPAVLAAWFTSHNPAGVWSTGVVDGATRVAGTLPDGAAVTLDVVDGGRSPVPGAAVVRLLVSRDV